MQTKRIPAAQPDVRIQGLPSKLSETDDAVLRSRLSLLFGELFRKYGPAAGPLMVSVGNGQRHNTPKVAPAERFLSQTPKPVGDRLVLPGEILNDVRRHVRRFEHRARLYDQRGLRCIDPHPRALLHLSGPPGCGKTLLAHAIAEWLKRPLLSVKYADIVSKYPGEGPANVDLLFAAATRDGAVLFIDEADGLLATRSASAQQGADHERNAVVNQFLVASESFEGVLVTATNSEACDPALLSRVAQIQIPSPDFTARRQLWSAHILPAMRPAANMCLDTLAALEGLTGRDIRNAVIDAVTEAELDDNEAELSMHHLVAAVQRIVRNRPVAAGPELAQRIRQAVSNRPEKSTNN
jgi:SpoVK/Ycf46/Vps4 family AAA+-type ATPase